MGEDDLEIPEVPEDVEENIEVVKKPVPEIKPKEEVQQIDPRIQELTNIVNNLEFLSNQVAVNSATINLLTEIKGLLSGLEKK